MKHEETAQLSARPLERLVSCLFVETDGAYFGIPTSGTKTVKTILEAAHEAASQLPVEVLPTQDGGVTVELENDALGRELIFSIPRDGSRRFFHVASSLTGHRLSGAVDLDIALENLFRWTAGKSSEISPIGLVLPRAKVKR